MKKLAGIRVYVIMFTFYPSEFRHFAPLPARSRDIPDILLYMIFEFQQFSLEFAKEPLIYSRPSDRQGVGPETLRPGPQR